MSNDWMKRKTIVNYTAYDIGCGCYTAKHERQFKKMFKRAARRTDKTALKRFES